MEIDITLNQYMVLKDLLNMLGIPRTMGTKAFVEVDGWHGRGRASFNRFEEKIHIVIEPFCKE